MIEGKAASAPGALRRFRSHRSRQRLRRCARSPARSPNGDDRPTLEARPDFRPGWPLRSAAASMSSLILPLRRPTDDTVALDKAAVRGIESIYPGFNFAKAGVMLLD